MILHCDGVVRRSGTPSGQAASGTFAARSTIPGLEVDVKTVPVAHCPIVTSDKIRYADTDRQGHVNNAVFATFFETGRVEVLYDPRQPLTADAAEFVIVSLSLRFEAEIHWPGQVDIGTFVTKLGNSSVHLGQVMYQEDRCVAQAETVIVQIGQTSRRPVPLTEEARTRLRELFLSP